MSNVDQRRDVYFTQKIDMAIERIGTTLAAINTRLEQNGQALDAIAKHLEALVKIQKDR